MPAPLASQLAAASREPRLVATLVEAMGALARTAGRAVVAADANVLRDVEGFVFPPVPQQPARRAVTLTLTLTLSPDAHRYCTSQQLEHSWRALC